VCVGVRVCECVRVCVRETIQGTYGVAQLVGSLKLYVSIAEYSLFHRALLQKRPIILRSLLIVATPHWMSRGGLCVCVCVCECECVRECESERQSNSLKRECVRETVCVCVRETDNPRGVLNVSRWLVCGSVCGCVCECACV